MKRAHVIQYRERDSADFMMSVHIRVQIWTGSGPSLWTRKNNSPLHPWWERGECRGGILVLWDVNGMCVSVKIWWCPRQTNSFAREKYLQAAFVSPFFIVSISFSRQLNAVDFVVLVLDVGAVFAAAATTVFSGCNFSFGLISSAVYQMWYRIRESYMKQVQSKTRPPETKWDQSETLGNLNKNV